MAQVEAKRKEVAGKDGEVAAILKQREADVAAAARQLDGQAQLAASPDKVVTHAARTATGAITVHIVQILY